MDATLAPREWWRNTEGIARPLVALLAVQAVGAAALVVVQDGTQWERWHGVIQAFLDGNSTLASERMRHVNDGISSGERVFTQVAGWVGIAAVVLLIIWAWRSVKNARALGRTGARLSPGWTIAAFLIPLASNVLIYLVYADLLRSSAPEAAPGSAWRSHRTPPIVHAWLVAKLGGFVCTTVAMASVFEGSSASSVRPLLAVGMSLNFLAIALTIPIVVQVTRHQEGQRDVEGVPTREQVTGAYPYGAYPAAVQQSIAVGPNGQPVPGWYVDPSGLHDFRYWDGVAWTEHVSRGGVASLSPVAPTPPASPTISPDWFPDPSGRHQWRFWGGDDWTPHVSDHGVHSDDPLAGPVAPPDPDDVIPTGP